MDGQAQPAPRAPEPDGPRPGHRRRRRSPSRPRTPPSAHRLRRLVHRAPGLAVLPAAAARGPQPARGQRAGAGHRTRRAVTRRLEVALLAAAPRSATSAAVLLVLPPGQAVAFLAVQQAVFGLLPGRLVRAEPQGHADRARRRARSTSCAARCSCPATSAAAASPTSCMGGLNYQIEHHLFPSMPRPNLRKVQPMVREFCASTGSATPRRRCSVVRIVVRYLNRVGLARARPVHLPDGAVVPELGDGGRGSGRPDAP